MSASLAEAQEQKIVPWEEIAFETKDTVVFEDAFPVTVGHLLFVPRKNTKENISQSFYQAQIYGEWLVVSKKADGYNIGINVGSSAGQTIMYPHVHLIPRTKNDCQDPIGGVRAVIAGQANYRKDTYNSPVTK
jgi:diadenosine tetraphosphate (Ap4A) HIT family hydrolase